MAGMLEYLMGPQENQLARIGGAMSSGFDAFQGEQDRQTAAAEKRRLLAKEEAAAKLEAEKRAFEQNKGRLTMLQTMGGNARDAGDQQAVGELYNQSVPLLDQVYGIKANPLVGGLRQLTDSQVATMPGNPADYFSFAPDGTPRFATQDFQNEQSQDRAAQLFGPGKVEALDPYKNYMQGGKTIQTAQAKPITPMYSMVPGTDYAVNMRNPSEGVHTGVMPQMTAAQSAADADRDRAFGARQANLSEVGKLRAAAAKATDARQMAAIRLRVKKFANDAATDPDTGIIDYERAKLNEEQLMVELNLISETEQAKRKAKQNEAQAGNAAKAGQEATAGIKRLAGGDAQLAAWAKYMPAEYEQMRAYLADRAMGKPVGRAPFEMSAVRNMVNASMNSEKSGIKPAANPSPRTAPASAPAKPTLGQAIAAPFQRTPQQTQNATEAMKRLNQYLPASMQFEVE
jgi:hypothetical protein